MADVKDVNNDDPIGIEPVADDDQDKEDQKAVEEQDQEVVTSFHQQAAEEQNGEDHKAAEEQSQERQQAADEQDQEGQKAVEDQEVKPVSSFRSADDREISRKRKRSSPPSTPTESPRRAKKRQWDDSPLSYSSATASKRRRPRIEYDSEDGSDVNTTFKDVNALETFDFSFEDLAEVQPLKPLQIVETIFSTPLSASTSSESNSPLKVKVRSVKGAFFRTKPPYPRPIVVKAKDGTRLSLFFTNKYVFSNHFPADFTVNEVEYSCSEQYYMRFKAVYFGDEQTAAEIMDTLSPKDMKKLGRKVDGFDENEWKKVSIQVMKVGCYHKFTQNKELRLELFRTSDTTLVEASPMDTYWGVGLSMESSEITNPARWRGKNVLGYILTELREHLMKLPQYQSEVKAAKKD